MKAHTERAARRFEPGEPARDFSDAVVVEEPLELRVDGDTLAITMRTPGNDVELALGLLLSEGIIASADDVGSAAHCGRPGEEGYGNVIDVRSAPGRVLDIDDIQRARRGTLTSAACGICGRRSIEDLIARAKPLDPTVRFARSTIEGLGERLRTQQPTFEKTGGSHAAALVAHDGTLVTVREDVGRHNAVDKVVGRALIDRALPASDRLLVVSGRVSFEIVQKAIAAGIPALVGVSAPSSLAVQTAESGGMLLAGFCRGGAFTVYSGAERIVNH